MLNISFYSSCIHCSMFICDVVIAVDL